LLAGKHAATGQLIFSVVDLQKMTPDGRNQLDPLVYQEIVGAAVRIRDIVQELSLLIEPASDDPST
jgi:hypothetical protein